MLFDSSFSWQQKQAFIFKRKQVSPNQKISTPLHSSSLYSPFKIHHCFISFWSLTRDMLFLETKNGYDNCISGSCRLREFLCSWEAQWRLCHSFKIVLIKSYSHLIITIFPAKTQTRGFPRNLFRSQISFASTGFLRQNGMRSVFCRTRPNLHVSLQLAQGIKPYLYNMIYHQEWVLFLSHKFKWAEFPTSFDHRSGNITMILLEKIISCFRLNGIPYFAPTIELRNTSGNNSMR